MAANVETMFYTREKPWHGLGTMVAEAPNSKDALRLAGLNWKVPGVQSECKRHRPQGAGRSNRPLQGNPE